jgi:hypothetical protein
VSSVNSLVAPDFLEIDRLDVTDSVMDLSEPLFKAQESHPTALKALGF